MTKACDFCKITNQFVCEGHCGKCPEHNKSEETPRIGAGFGILEEETPNEHQK